MSNNSVYFKEIPFRVCVDRNPRERKMTLTSTARHLTTIGVWLDKANAKVRMIETFAHQ